MAEREESLWQRILVSKLIDASELERCQKDVDSDFDDSALFDLLMRRGLLTRWQCAQLQAGRTRNLVLGHYKLLAPLGTGGMGAVFRALDTKTGSPVAVKVLAGRMATADAVGRFRREAMATLEMRHEHIVRAFELAQQGAVHFLVMDLIDGPSLAQYLVQKQRLAVQETARIGFEVAQALDHAFRHNIIHRDIKPSNILLSRDGQVRLADLGLAKFFGQQAQEGPETRTGQFLGTIDYCSPEQCEDAKRADIRSDIYSLGCTLYHCLTGKPPFEGTEVQRIMAHLERLPDPVTWINDEVPAEFAHLIEARMMAKKPSDRFATPSEMVEALRPWAMGETREEENLWAGIAGLDNLLDEVEHGDAAGCDRKSEHCANILPQDRRSPGYRARAVPHQPPSFAHCRPSRMRAWASRPLIWVSLLLGLGSLAVASRHWPHQESPHEQALRNTIGWTDSNSSLGDRTSAANEDPVDEGAFRAIFNGSTLDGWWLVGSGESFIVEDGLLICPEGATGKLLTSREYANFILRFEFLLEPGANNGVGIRAPLEGDAAYAGMEIQILDDSAAEYAHAPSFEYHGSLYGVASAKRGAPLPAGQWNSEEIRCDGDHLVVTVNGHPTLDVDLADFRDRPTLDNKAHPGLNRASGHIGFLAHRSRVNFRKIRIHELPNSSL